MASELEALQESLLTVDGTCEQLQAFPTEASMITSCLISVIRCFKNASHPASLIKTYSPTKHKRGVSGARFWPAQ